MASSSRQSLIHKRESIKGPRASSSIKSITQENAASAAQLESESIPQSHSQLHSESEHRRKKRTKRKHSKHRHQHRHHRHSATTPNYDKCEGVIHVILTDDVQHLLKCVVGENVTAEKPWTHVNKYYISEQVESEDVPQDYLGFLPYKQQISEYPNDTMLIGYIPDESRDYDEFFFALTQAAEEEVTKLVQEQEARQQARLENTINKRVGEWTSYGSEAGVEEAWMQNSRGLFMIEFEAKYPIMSPDVQFRCRLVNAARDGYAELMVGPRYNVAILNRRRIDNSIQVAPTVHENIAQTFCSYPKNAWTQYEYYVDYINNLSKEWMNNFRLFIDSTIDEFSDTLNVNGDINFYTNDYVDLIDNALVVLGDSVYQEYQSFYDVKRCMNKMISALSWHPMWTGVVAIAYANISPRWYYTEERGTEDLMKEIVHGFNPILIWSFNDTLYPKLILETNSEVHCLSFCPHDGNLLVGGCANGQIILWDIKNKLTKVETEEILTPAQQSYRTRLYGEMYWMKNTRDYSLVPPTAFSQLLFSHMNNVTAIEWIHPMYKCERTGHIEPVGEQEPVSLQFISSSSDGTIKFWDLQQKVTLTGDYKPVRRSRRLGKRPSALTMDVSPYRILNRRMLPIFEVDINILGSENLCPVASISIPAEKVKYQNTNPDRKRASITERVIYESLNVYPEKPVMPVITLGTYNGDFAIATWHGYEYTSGDVFSKEDAKFLTCAKYHDGPVLTVQRHPDLEDVYLSVGGKIFCIWVEKLKAKPLIWRRSRNKYTHGNWERGRAACFWFTTSDGSREYWNLDFKSDGPFSAYMYSGKPLMESEVHPLPVQSDTERIFGLADDRGSLRLIYYNAHNTEDQEELATFIRLINNNADRALDFEEWQTNWTDNHASWIKEQAEQELAEQTRLREEAMQNQAYEEEMRAKEAIEEAKREQAKLHPPAGKYDEWAKERWILKEQERMGNELLSNKRLDKDTLVRQQAPLKKLEAEAARKQMKIKQRLAKVDEIFNETIAMLFPNMVEKTMGEVSEKIIYSEDQKQVMEENFLSAFENIKDESNGMIEDNPFVYELDWKHILSATKTNILKEEFRYIGRHSDRHKRDMIERDTSNASFSIRGKSRESVNGEGEAEEDRSSSLMFAF